LEVKPLRAIIIYIGVILVLGALIAPWLYWGGHWLAETWSVAEALRQFPFHRYFNRAIMLVAFVGLFWVVRAMGVRRWADVGVRSSPTGWRDFGVGFSFGVASIATLAALALLVGEQRLKTGLDVHALTGAVGKSLASGLAVGILEEIFFRGAVYGGMRRGMSFAPALLISSFIFSIVHFLKPLPTPAGMEIHWWSGFATLATCGQGNFSPPFFVTLLCAGILLAWAYEKTGTLPLPIGVHAGWVFVLQLNPRLFEGTGRNPFWFGSGSLEKGWAATVLMLAVMTVTAIVVWRCVSRRRIQTA
jgi:membrane protease YdiL (CAAX protease family)